MLIKKNSTVLFQGDSITDGERDRNDPNGLGTGYALMIASLFSAAYPDWNVKFMNRGNSGNRVKDLAARWKSDCLDLKPDVVSIMIGINDTWRRYDNNDATSAEVFENHYREILKATRNTLGAKLILIEPFVLPVPSDRLGWRVDLDPKIEVVGRLAGEFNAELIPMDRLMTEACKKREPAFWAADGVHPTPVGQALLAKAWLKAIDAE